MMPDSTTRLLQILRTTLALVKYYEGHPASVATIGELKRSIQRAINDLAAIEAAEKTPDLSDIPDFLSEIDISELDPDRG